MSGGAGGGGREVFLVANSVDRPGGVTGWTHRMAGLFAARGHRVRLWERGDRLADRFRPSPLQEQLVAEGRLGRKTGSGWYDDPGGPRAIVPGAAQPDDAAVVVERIEVAIALEAWRALEDRVARDAADAGAGRTFLGEGRGTTRTTRRGRRRRWRSRPLPAVASRAGRRGRRSR